MINRERILDEAHLKQLNYEGDYHDDDEYNDYNHNHVGDFVGDNCYYDEAKQLDVEGDYHDEYNDNHEGGNADESGNYNDTHDHCHGDNDDDDESYIK